MSAGSSFSELRLSKHERSNVLRVMEQRKPACPVDSRRRTERHEYEPAVAPLVEITGAAAAFVVVARNLSTGGIAFLHGGPIEPGTACSVTLFDSQGTGQTFGAAVIRCDRIAGRIHDIGVKFEVEVDVAPFLAPPQRAPKPTHASGSSSGTVDAMAGLVTRLRELERTGWPGDEVRAVLKQVADLCSDASSALGSSKGAH